MYSKRNSGNRPNLLLSSSYLFLAMTPVLALLALFALPQRAYADGFPIIGTLYTGGRPEALGVDTQTHLVYIGSEGPGEIICFDPLSGTVRWRVQTGAITDLQVDSTRHLVYAFENPQKQRSGVLVLDGATGHQIYFFWVENGGDNSLVLDTKSDSFFVLDRSKSTISAVHLLPPWPQLSEETIPIGPENGPKRQYTVQEPNAVERQIVLGGHPIALAINSRLEKVYIADSDKHLLSVFDEKPWIADYHIQNPTNQQDSIARMHFIIDSTPTNKESYKPSTTIPIGTWALPPIHVDEATGRVYVLCAQSQELDVIDGKNNTVIARTTVAPYPEGITTQTSTGRIYVANEGDPEGGGKAPVPSDTISVLDGQSYALVGTLKVGRAPDGVAADPALKRVYVVTEESKMLVEVSDNVNLPLQSDPEQVNLAAARRVAEALRWTALVILIAMIVTVTGATMVELLQRRRGRESPQTQPVGVSSRSDAHSLRR